jgi:hypothetical protein
MAYVYRLDTIRNCGRHILMPTIGLGQYAHNMGVLSAPPGLRHTLADGFAWLAPERSLVCGGRALKRNHIHGYRALCKLRL